MKIFKVISLVALVAVIGCCDAVAQGVVKKRTGENDKKNSAQPGVTPRMEAFYEDEEVSDADLVWMRVIYRSLDLTNEQNMALYYPEEPTENQENLFRIIMRLIANNQVAAYEYLDGREVFTDQYKIKVRDMLDRFHILYTEAKGSTEKNPKFTIEESDVPCNEVLSYYVLERWEFDRVSNRMNQKIEAICPVLHRAGDFGGEAVKYPMFWIKYDALRATLSQQYVFTDNDNNLEKYNYDDFFMLRLYKGDIYKTRNLKNLSLMQMYPDPDDLRRAQDSIDNRLNSYGKHLWVPTREELQARAEAEAAAADTAHKVENREVVASETKPATKRSTKRGSKSTSSTSEKKKKAPKVKEQKAPKSSGSATRSVRRRK
ncbi:MAG: gliding motility protein GldN [Bacteroidales bacterium]|nr:gliding motility protein GldN [Bacteroidales bacterium]